MIKIEYNWQPMQPGVRGWAADPNQKEDPGTIEDAAAMALDVIMIHEPFIDDVRFWAIPREGAEPEDITATVMDLISRTWAQVFDWRSGPPAVIARYFKGAA